MIAGIAELIRSIMRQEHARQAHARKHTRLLKVTNYDGKKYTARGKFWPEDQNDPNNNLSGDIPINVQSTGDGFGVYHGLNVDDLVEVTFQGGDHMVGRITGRHVTEQHKPPYEIPAGETHMIHQSGAVIRKLKDGTLFIGGAGTVPPPAANPNSQSNTAGQPAAPSQPSQPQALQTFTMKPNGDMEMTSPQGKHSLTSKGEALFQSSTDDVTLISSQKKIYAVTQASEKGSAKAVKLADGSNSKVLFSVS